MIEENKIELRSPKIDEIISAPPGFLLRSGSFLILSTIILILIFSAIIKIPEYINSNAVIKFSNNKSIVFIVSELSPGQALLVKKGQEVIVNINGMSEFKYGRIICKISDLKGSKATCHLELPIKTNYNNIIHFDEVLNVSVRILVEKQSILSKIISPLMFFFKNSHSYF